MARNFKTRQVSLNIPRNFHSWTKWEVGDYVLGKWFKTLKDNYDHDCPVIEVYEYSLTNPVTNKRGDEVDIHEKNLQINSSGSINAAFYGNDKNDPIFKEGDIVKVIFAGQMDADRWYGDMGKPKSQQPPLQFEFEIVDDEAYEEESDDDDV